jgi:hypothetical protein
MYIINIRLSSSDIQIVIRNHQKRHNFLNNVSCSTMDPPAETQFERSLAVRGKKSQLTSCQRQAMVAALIMSIKDGNDEQILTRGAITAVARRFHVHRETVANVWARARENFLNPEINSFRSESLRMGNSGRKIKWNRAEVQEAVKEIPLHQRGTIRDLAVALGIPKTTVWRMLSEGKEDDGMSQVIMPVTIALKPLLTDAHKVNRMVYCCRFLNAEQNTFHDFYNHVHVDEKWFFVCPRSLRLYLAADEERPQIAVQNRDHIIKVMFLCAIARPRYDAAGVCTFNGKIGMWPFVEQAVAARRSVNRPRGAIIQRPVVCTKNVYRRMMIEHVVPAIKRRWPDQRGLTRITIQHDGASAHIEDNDVEFREHARNPLWEISILTQPAKSPDLNVLDLSFFRALQSEQWRSAREFTIGGLVNQVLAAFERFEVRKIDFGFLTLQSCMDDILKVDGGNAYSIRHMGKEALLRAGELPVALTVTDEAMEIYELMVALGDNGQLQMIQNGVVPV